MGLSTSSSPESNAFTKLEHKNWQRGVEAYTEGFGPLTSQAVSTLLEKAGYLLEENDGDCSTSEVCDDIHLLDVACGPGQVLSAAISKAKSLEDNNILQKPACSYTGLDFSSNFLQLAKENLGKDHPDTPVLFEEGDAQNMVALDSNQFTSVTSNFGILHLSDPDAFLRESFRVLKPGGRLAFSAWSPPPKTEAFALILGAVHDAGNPDVVLPDGPPFFRFSDPNEIQRSMKNAGFEDLDITVVESMEWKNVVTCDDLYYIMLEGTARTRELLRCQTRKETDAIRSELKKRFEARSAEKVEMPFLRMPAVVSSGRKPLLQDPIETG